MGDFDIFDDLSRNSKEEDKKILSQVKRRAKPSASKKYMSTAEKIEEIRKKVDLNLSFLSENIDVCDTAQRLDRFNSHIQDDKLLSIDCETDGTDYFTSSIFGWSAYVLGEKSIYIPRKHISHLTGDRVLNQIPDNVVKEYLSRWTQYKIVGHNVKFDAHMFYHNYGVKFKIYWDTMIASRLLHNDEEDHSLKGQFTEKIIKNNGIFKGKSTSHLKFGWLYGINQEASKFSFRDLFSEVDPKIVPIDIMARYAAGDTLETLALQEYQEEEFKLYPNVYYVFKEIEMPILNIVIEMEERGVNVDRNKVLELRKKYQNRAVEAAKRCYNELDKVAAQIGAYNIKNPGKLSTPINLNSSQQLAIIFYDILKLEPIKKGKTFERTTSKKALEKYKNVPFVKCLSEYKDADKVLSMFLNEDAIVSLIKSDGRIHPDWIQVPGSGNYGNEDDESGGAETGRFASRSPNLQQVSSKGESAEVRNIFAADEGEILFGADYSKQEVVLLAAHANDEIMRRAFAEDKDIYSMIAAQAFHTTYENCLEFNPDGSTNKEGKKRRAGAKSVLLGLMYGRGAESIAEQLDMSKDEAQQIIDGFYKGFPTVRRWMDKAWEFTHKHGYVETMWGRRRYLPHATLPKYQFKCDVLKPKDFNPLNFTKTVLTNELDEETRSRYITRLNRAKSWTEKNNIILEAKNEGITITENSNMLAKAERQTINTHMQGSAGDETKRAMILVSTDPDWIRLGGKILIPVHDELICSAPIENAYECSKILERCMIQAAAERCSIPMKVDSEFSYVWSGEKYRWDGNSFVRGV